MAQTISYVFSFTLKPWIAGYQRTPSNSIANIPNTPNTETMEMVWVNLFTACCIFLFQIEHLDV